MIRRVKAVALATHAVLIGGCSATHLLTALTPDQQVQILRDVAYGQHPRQMLDIYRPLQGEQHPVVVFVYGGSWQNGDRTGYGFVGKRLAQAGYVTVVIDYRLAPEHRYPAFVQDTADAIGWTYRQIAQYGGDPMRIAVMGHSAGAFNAITAIDDLRFWQTTGVPDQAICTVIGLAGPYAYDFRTDPTKIAFPADGKPDAIMPDRIARKGAPPHVLLIGEKDNVVGRFNATKLHARLVQQGVPVTVQQIDRVNHASMIVAFTPAFNFLGKTPQIVLQHLNTACQK